MERRDRARYIAEKSRGIYPPFEAFYVQSIMYAASACDRAFQRYNRLATKQKDRDAVVGAVQEALTHAAALSRFFWPSRRDELSDARAENLREAFGVTESSPIRMRTLRNALEHFDERLDNFLLDDRVGNFFPGAMVGKYQASDEAPAHVFRMVDPEASTFVVLNVVYDFSATSSEVKRLLRMAQKMDKQGSRLRLRESSLNVGRR